MNKVQEIRIKHHMKKSEFAKYLGIDRIHLYRLEKGLVKPGNKTLELIKEKFPDVDINIFFKY